MTEPTVPEILIPTTTVPRSLKLLPSCALGTSTTASRPRAAKPSSSRTWQIVGRADQVGKPGDYLTANVAGEPIVVVRGQDNQLRALLSTSARHHAAAVMTEHCATDDSSLSLSRLELRPRRRAEGRARVWPEYRIFDPVKNGLMP